MDNRDNKELKSFIEKEDYEPFPRLSDAIRRGTITINQKTGGFGSRLILGAALIVLIIALIIGIVAFIGHRADEAKYAELMKQYDEAMRSADVQTIEVDPEISITDATIREAMSPAALLVSYKYSYAGIGLFEKSKDFLGFTVPFSTDKSVYAYTGTIGVGIDMDKVKVSVDEGKKRVSVTLPQPGVIYHEMDEDNFEVFDVQNSIFTEVKLDDYADFIASLKEKEEVKLSENQEFWTNVKKESRTIIENLIEPAAQPAGYAVLVAYED